MVKYMFSLCPFPDESAYDLLCATFSANRSSRLVAFRCMHACMHVCMNMNACMHVCMYACMHVCMYACVHVCMYACMHVCMYACIIIIYMTLLQLKVE